MTADNVFHCLYVTADLSCSLITGGFEAMNVEEKLVNLLSQ